MMNLVCFAFVLFHSTIPAVFLGFYGTSPMWLLGSILFSIAIIRSVHRNNSQFVRLLLCLLSGTSILLTLMLGASYYMQGTAFNDQFFFHVEFNTLLIAAQAYGKVFYASLFYLILAFLAPFVLYRLNLTPVKSNLLTIVFWSAALATNYPLFSLVNYLSGHGDELSVALSDIPVGPDANTGQDLLPDDRIKTSVESPGDSVASTTTPKNIILIYAEGLEQLYFDRGIFGDILPNIRELSAQAHQFTNVYQVKGTSWTIAGIVASQCGFPLLQSSQLVANSTMASSEKPFGGERCLADVLQAKGYRNVFMGGAPLFFAGKGNFLKTHGYQKTMGRDELMPMVQDKEYNFGWGLYDDSLLGLALEEFKTLEKRDEPYLLTLLTIDTHHPDGHPSRSCQKLADSDEPMSNAIYCSDQLLSEFVRNVMEIADMEKTLIVLFSDHLSMRNSLWEKLRAHRKERRLTWMMFNDKPGRLTDQVATHFDVAPTLLEAAGINDYAPFGLGTSLFSKPAGEKASRPPRIDEEKVPRNVLTHATLKESGVQISYRDRTISVGDLTVKAHDNGWQFAGGLFLIVLDDDGVVIDTAYSRDFAKLQKELDGFLVVGISIHENPSRYGDQYFFGRFSPDLNTIDIRVLNQDVHINASQVFSEK
jgi:hypothetical protein